MTEKNENTRISELIVPEPAELTGGSLWSPVVGQETLDFVDGLGLNHEAGQRLRDEALRVLSRCVPPRGSQGTDTGLVIGYVQSGKTMSFTAVSALARDNGYPLVVLLTGTSVNLFDQSTQRVERDLRLQTRDDRAWLHLRNPSKADVSTIRDVLRQWDQPVPGLVPRTVFLSVMKNATRLKNLISVLGSLDLAGIPALVLDDEADQAGLNTLVNQGDESSTYRSLREIRSSLPHHTFLQYTATPQAPLLLNLIDILSPSFAEVLTPGAEYVGGKQFFLDNPHLIRTIPPSEITTSGRPPVEPPPSLLEAMRLFFLGVAFGLLRDEGKGNRSMLIHPAQAVDKHRQYLNWAQSMRDEWLAISRLPTDEPDRGDLFDGFRSAYAELAKNISGAPSPDELLPLVPAALLSTRVTEVNTRRGRTPSIDWSSDYAHILVGGQAMDRGFTVVGLTVTYMPRGIGVGNADTVQQRARFFGYKRSYLEFCRVYLENTVRDAYRHYVEHEEDIRRQLQRLSNDGRPLGEWKRAFFLTHLLRPTRDNVLDLNYMRGGYADRWFEPNAIFDSVEAATANRIIVDAFLAALTWGPDEGDPLRTKAQRHGIATASLAETFEYLVQLRITQPDEAQRWLGLLLQVGKYLEDNPHAQCSIYRMSPSEQRERTVDDDGQITELFQGRNPRTGVAVYPGDREIRAPHGLTAQVYDLNLKSSSNPGTIVAEHVPAVAVWVPAEMGRDFLVQNES